MSITYGPEANRRFHTAVSRRRNEALGPLLERVEKALLKGMTLRIQRHVMTFHSHLLICAAAATTPHFNYLTEVLQDAGLHVQRVPRGLVVTDSE